MDYGRFNTRKERNVLVIGRNRICRLIDMSILFCNYVPSAKVHSYKTFEIKHLNICEVPF